MKRGRGHRAHNNTRGTNKDEHNTQDINPKRTRGGPTCTKARDKVPIIGGGGSDTPPPPV